MSRREDEPPTNGRIMTAPHSTTPSGPPPGGGAPSAPERAPEPTGTTLRGAGVDVDVRRVGRVAVGLCLVALAVVAAILFVVGAHKNAQITRLRQHGVPVTVTVTGCLGLLGGSGSNAAGYACKGRFVLDGHRYLESVPGNVLRPVGTKVRAVAAAGDPPLLSTRQEVDTRARLRECVHRPFDPSRRSRRPYRGARREEATLGNGVGNRGGRGWTYCGRLLESSARRRGSARLLIDRLEGQALGGRTWRVALVGLSPCHR